MTPDGARTSAAFSGAKKAGQADAAHPFPGARATEVVSSVVLRRPDEVIGRGSSRGSEKTGRDLPVIARRIGRQARRAKDAAFRQSTGKVEALRAKLARGEITAPADIEQDVVFAGVVQALPTTVKPKDLESILGTILLGLPRSGSRRRFPWSSNRRGAIHPAACRLDGAGGSEEEIITLLDDNGLPEVPVMPASATVGRELINLERPRGRPLWCR